MAGSKHHLIAHGTGITLREVVPPVRGERSRPRHRPDLVLGRVSLCAPVLVPLPADPLEDTRGHPQNGPQPGLLSDLLAPAGSFTASQFLDRGKATTSFGQALHPFS
ncbi:hypothetical protein ACFC5Z_15715 [Streptomyces sp. NPDC056004]|uniref:hypothetical protein n=1 Tax=unclassified Streptomyces TaxID=2593676 RepID=UPI0035DC74D0